MQLEITYKDLPENVFFIYTTICRNKYGIINEHATAENKKVYEYACRFLYENNKESIIYHRDTKVLKEELYLFNIYMTKHELFQEGFSHIKKCIENKLKLNRDEKLA